MNSEQRALEKAQKRRKYMSEEEYNRGPSAKVLPYDDKKKPATKGKKKPATKGK